MKNERKYCSPFVKTFKTRKFHYVYDVNTNEIIRIDPIIYAFIEDLDSHNFSSIVNKLKQKYSIEKFLQRIADAKKSQENLNLFSSHRPIIFSGIGKEEDIRYILNTNLEQLVLELTERCNNRCAYCAFSGRYPLKRTHRDIDMPIQVAREVINFFLGKSRNKTEYTTPAITFYGGEPLLRFDLIKDTVEFVKKKGAADRVSFSLTTNGTLLTDEIISYFVENNISIMISLDGPARIHDKYRVSRDGSGTFARIMENIKRIKKHSKEYFENRISFIAIATPPYDIDTIINFYYNQKFFEPFHSKIKIDFVDDFETEFFKDFKLNDHPKKLIKESNRLRTRYKHALINNKYEKLTVEKSLFLKAFHSIACRPMELLGEKYPALGACWPGQRRLFVNTGGDFFMCEKVGSNLKIGSVYDGFDYPRIYTYLKEYDQFFSDCGECWALRFCKKCFNDIRHGEEFDLERKERFCRSTLKNLERNLIFYCEVLERNREAFTFLKDVSVI